MRNVKTEFVSCPSCGRTLFDLQEVTAQISDRTGHLPGVTIAIMGCIVNGPGEMADADFGYVGGAPGMVDLYVGKTVVRSGIPNEDACDALVELIKENDRWVCLRKSRRRSFVGAPVLAPLLSRSALGSRHLIGARRRLAGAPSTDTMAVRRALLQERALLEGQCAEGRPEVAHRAAVSADATAVTVVSTPASAMAAMNSQAPPNDAPPTSPIKLAASS